MPALEPGQTRRHIRPGIESMPRQVQLVFFVFAESGDGKPFEGEFEIAPVQHVEFAKGDPTCPHLFHGALIFAAPGVCERGIIEADAFRLQQRLGFPRDRVLPIDQRATSKNRALTASAIDTLPWITHSASRRRAPKRWRSNAQPSFCENAFAARPIYAAACRRRSIGGSTLLPAS